MKITLKREYNYTHGTIIVALVVQVSRGFQKTSVAIFANCCYNSIVYNVCDIS